MPRCFSQVEDPQPVLNFQMALLSSHSCECPNHLDAETHVVRGGFPTPVSHLEHTLFITKESKWILETLKISQVI